MTDDTESEETRYDFDEGFQSSIVATYLRDSRFAQHCGDLIEPRYFTNDANARVVDILRRHVTVHKSVPGPKSWGQVLKDEILAKRVKPDEIADISAVLKESFSVKLEDPSYMQKKVSDFARYQAIEQAMLGSLDNLEKGAFAEIERAMLGAFSVGHVDDEKDYNYWQEIEHRTKHREAIANGTLVRDGITTGLLAMDGYLYHGGWGRKELSCLMGPAKSGKSALMGNFAKNAVLAGFNVGMFNLEVRSQIISDRIDSVLSSVMMKDLNKSREDVQEELDAIKNKGQFLMRDYASGTMQPSTLLRNIERWRADGNVMDLIVVDYADIMAAQYRSDELRENLRSIYIDLRAIATEQNVAILTATQTNREGAKAMTAKSTDVGDDINKVRTVDVLIGINATDAEKQANEMRLYWAASRNSEDGFSLQVKQDRERMDFVKSIIGRI